MGEEKHHHHLAIVCDCLGELAKCKIKTATQTAQHDVESVMWVLGQFSAYLQYGLNTILIIAIFKDSCGQVVWLA